MMRFIFPLVPLLCLFTGIQAQQKEKTISITCYANAELYMDAGVIAYVSDNDGNISCQGNYVAINNKSNNTFYYQDAGKWIPVKSEMKTVAFMPGPGTSEKSPSVIKLTIKYSTDMSGNITSKIKTIDQLNMQSDRVKARQFEGEQAQKQEVAGTMATRSSNEPTAGAPKKAVVKPSPANVEQRPIKQNPVAKTKSSTHQPTSSATRTRQTTARSTPRTRTSSSSQKSKSIASTRAQLANALGLRVDFGSGPTGIGPNFKHRFKHNVSLDASIVFFEGDVASLGAQLEKNFSISSSDPGLSLYLGVGPQLLFGHDDSALALVPVGGLEYNIPKSPLNLSFDWRPNFYFSPANKVDAGRFGFSFRFQF